ncbi:MAG: GNAT family N-acetyltransferase [Thermoplasmata archaeon]|nr:GNAT family N-acetyltransferase [Thermoplasmata archaeon]
MPDDYESFATILKQVRPDYPVSAETLRHEEEAFGPGPFHQRYVVEVRTTGQVVAIGGLEQDPAAERGKFWVFALVLPGFQGRGIGGGLYETLLASAREHDGVSLWSAVLEDELAGQAFLLRRGFVERRRNWTSVLDLEAAATDRLLSLSPDLAAAGIEISTLAREGVTDAEVAEQLYRLDCETSVDVPRMYPYVPIPLAAFRRFYMEGPNALPEAWFIAKHRGRYVAMSFAQREAAAPDTLEQAYTCTQRDYRRRGLALALKLRVIEYGKRNRYRWIRTHNDSLNAPMWALNERLGFHRVSTIIQTEKGLSRED